MKNMRFTMTILLINAAVIVIGEALIFGQDAVDHPEIQAAVHLSLEEATRLALHNSYDIQLVKYDIWISRAGQGNAESIYDTFFSTEANYQNDQTQKTSTIFGSESLDNNYNIGLSKRLPSGTDISLDLANHRSWNNAPFATSALTHDSNLKLTVEQALGRNFFGLKDRGEIKVTQLDIENTLFTSLDKMETAAAAAQKAYWDLALALRSRDISRDMLAQSEELYRLHQERISDGLSEPPELYAAEANYRQRLAELAIDENDIQSKTNVLKLLLNVSPDVPDVIVTDGWDLPEHILSTEEAVRSALENRRDYQAGLIRVRQKGIELEVSANGLWPEIHLTASLAKNGLDDHFPRAVSQISGEDHDEIFTGLKISFPLENTKARAELDKAKLEKAKALTDLKLLEKQIIIGVADRLREAGIFLRQARSRQDITQLQTIKLEEEKKRFRAGRSNTDTIIRFQEDLLKARWEEARAAYECRIKLIDLRKAQGALLNDYWDGEL
jgi:outer membrane protein TolC